MERDKIFKPLTHIFTTHVRIRFAERVLQIPLKTDSEKYELANRKRLNFKIKTRIAGSVVIEDKEIDSMFRNYLQETYGHHNYQFYLIVAIKQELPLFVTCYKKDGGVGAFHFADLYNKYYHTGKLK